jgi:hypothetical protein
MGFGWREPIVPRSPNPPVAADWLALSTNPGTFVNVSNAEFAINRADAQYVA